VPFGLASVQTVRGAGYRLVPGDRVASSASPM
jgi:hypothetical protein